MAEAYPDEAAMNGATGGLQRRCLLGDAGTGKTDALVASVAELVRSGVEPRQILVLAASPSAARELCARLSRELGRSEATEIGVTTPRVLELQVLGDDRAEAVTGRNARVMTTFETNVLVEDLKTSGLRPGRLREMLKFFQRGWTELADDDPSWLFTDEELSLHGLVKQCLAYARSVMPAEIAGLAVRALRADATLLEGVRRDHVLVDDYQLLCRASQEFVGMLAKKTLTVAGDAGAVAETFEPYPYGEGLDEFAKTEGVSVERLTGTGLPEGIAQVAESLRQAADECLSKAERVEAGDSDDEVPAASMPAVDSVERIDFATPEDEVTAVADRVARAVEGGTDPSRVYVAVPNRVWASAVAAELGRRGMKADRMLDPRMLNGDVRELARCEAARAFTLLGLVADRDDDLAWRSWCGFGDWLANSPGFVALRRCSLPLHEALEAICSSSGDVEEMSAELCGDLAPDERESLARIVESYRHGCDLVDGLAGLEGDGLLDRVWTIVAGGDGQRMPEWLRDLFEFEGSSAADAARYLECALRRLDEAGFSGAEGAVKVGPLEAVRGIACDLLVVEGFVNGFMPRHAYFDEVSTSPAKRMRMYASEARRLYGALGGCSGEVVFTSFETIDALRAERLGLKVDRYRMVDGVRTALVSSSVLLK